MASFEKFHPVLTAHYTLDWLTQTPVKQIDNLVSGHHLTTVAAEKFPTQILDTVRDVNHIMQRVMSGTELTWGITNSNDGTFKGVITLSGFSEPNETGHLDFTFTESEIQGLSEVITRTIEFAEDHFNFKALIVELNAPSTTIPNILQENGFEALDQLTFKRAISPTS